MNPVAHIVLTDDDPDDCFLFSSISTELNQDIKVTCLHDCRDLLNYLANGNPPDILFLDLNMPVLSGFDCLRKIKENNHWKTIPIVIYSTSSRKETIDECYALGADLYIVKPNDSEKLRDAINSAVKQFI